MARRAILAVAALALFGGAALLGLGVVRKHAEEATFRTIRNHALLRGQDAAEAEARARTAYQALRDSGVGYDAALKVVVTIDGL